MPARGKTNLKDNTNFKLLMLFLFALIGVGLFIGLGLTPRNMNFNLPRRIAKITAILLVSYSVAYSSVVFQTVTNNKILTPSVMGLDSLYMFIQTVVVFFFGARQLALMSDLTQFFISVILMTGSSMLLYVFLFKEDSRNIYFLILIGIVFGGLFGGLSNFMQVLLDPNEFLILQGRMFASFSNINVKLLSICAVIIILCLLFSLGDLKNLDVLSLGEYHAINLGIDYKKLVKKQFIVISVLVSVSTALVGPVTFLGILLTSLAREVIKGYRHNYLIVSAFLISVLSLVYSLFIVERMLNFETTMNVIINFVGGIYFIYIVLKESRI